MLFIHFQSEILKQIDGNKSIEEILENVAKKSSTSRESVLAEWNVIFKYANLVDLIVLNMP